MRSASDTLKIISPEKALSRIRPGMNIFIGTGGPEGINKSHFAGAAYGMERMMGRADTPVRRMLNYAARAFAADLPIVYVHTVVGRGDGGELKTRGLYIGDDDACFERAAELSTPSTARSVGSIT